MIDPRDACLNTISINSSSVVNHPGFVFLCGGALYSGKIDPPPLSSVRDYLNRKFIHHHSDIYIERFVLAETFEAWKYKEHYNNLIDLERDIAHLADRIILVAESPGSIAELGAFSVMKELSKKLIVFVSRNDHGKLSFVRLGPIDYLKSLNEHAVNVYPWEVKYRVEDNEVEVQLDETNLDIYYADIASDILETLPKKERKREFNSELPNHIMLLMVDLLELFHILNFKEVKQYLDLLNIQRDEQTLKKYLFILENFDLIHKTEYSNATWYIKGKASPGKHMSYSLNGDVAGFNRTRVQAQVGIYYNSMKSRKRLNALREGRQELAGGRTDAE